MVGSPYEGDIDSAKGISGNVATGDVLYMINGPGIETGVDNNKAIAAGTTTTQALGRRSGAKVAFAGYRR